MLRGASKDLTQYLRKLERSGLTITRTKGDHVRVSHPSTPHVVICSLTSSDWRSVRNLRTNVQRTFRHLNLE
jgi:predicted RNA binding protein YcfA (HicA-like mRNA interferase family)